MRLSTSRQVLSSLCATAAPAASAKNVSGRQHRTAQPWRVTGGPGGLSTVSGTARRLSRMTPTMRDHNTAAARVAATQPTVTLIDIGINLAHDSYDADREAVIARARAAGVTQMLV